MTNPIPSGPAPSPGIRMATVGTASSEAIAQVVITTSDCGRLLLRDGVTRSNNEGIAARLSPPGEYRIEVGTASWSVRGLLHALRRDPTAFGFEPAP